jgi:hypothetical protein
MRLSFERFPRSGERHRPIVDGLLYDNIDSQHHFERRPCTSQKTSTTAYLITLSNQAPDSTHQTVFYHCRVTPTRVTTDNCCLLWRRSAASSQWSSCPSSLDPGQSPWNTSTKLGVSGSGSNICARSTDEPILPSR